jgi:thiamine-monophosphate kinase
MTKRAPRRGEFELIARYFAPLAAGFPGAYGLLDDAAVIAPLPGHELVAKTDAIVGGIHFALDDPPALVARKALRVNLSDLAAKGAVPRAYLLDLILPATVGEDWIAGFAGGLACDQQIYGVHLIGGDTDSTPGPPTIAIMAFGDVAAGQMLRRGGARGTDLLYVTGTIGDAALGLRAARGALPDLGAGDREFLVDRYRLPQPRVALGPRLVGLASATIDISDGLLADLAHLCEVSGLAACVDAHRVPLSPAARAALASQPALRADVLTGGDDYEILFTAPRAARAALESLSRELDVPIAAIGRMQSVASAGARPIAIVDRTGRPLALPGRAGWTHF